MKVMESKQLPYNKQPSFRYLSALLKVNILEKEENLEAYFKTVGYCRDNFD